MARGVAERPAPAAGFGRGARILPAAIGVTGLVTYAYFGLASHALGAARYGGITLLWSAIFITTSVLYRPVEQLLSRTISDRATRRLPGRSHLRVAALLQLALGVLFAIGALLLRTTLERNLFHGATALYWILVVAVLAYAASYFARGFLAGNRRFDLYGGLVLIESVSRCLFALIAVIGLVTGQTFVALGMGAAPLLSLCVVPWALGRRLRAEAARDDEEGLPAGTDPGGAPDVVDERAGEFTLAHGTGFAGAVLVIMLAEQTFLNAGPLLVNATAGLGAAALAGFAFNVLLIVRAPLQLFQAVQTVILPHLTRLDVIGETDPFRRSIKLTVLAIAAFAGLVVVAVLAIGPQAMHVVFGSKHYDYGRFGLAIISVGMGIYLAAATLNQAALARGRAKQAVACWIAGLAAFVVLLVIPGFGSDKVLQVEVAYLGGSICLCGLLYLLYRTGNRTVENGLVRSSMPT